MRISWSLFSRVPTLEGPFRNFAATRPTLCNSSQNFPPFEDFETPPPAPRPRGDGGEFCKLGHLI